MDILEDFNDLRKNDDALDDLLQDLRHLYDLLHCCVNGHFGLFEPVDELNLGFNVVDHVVGLDQSGHFGDLFSQNFNSLLVDSSDCNLDDLLLDDWNFNWYFLVNSDRHDLLNDPLHDFVDPNELRKNGLQLHNLDLLDKLFNNSVDGDDPGDFHKFLHDFFDDLLDDLDISGVLGHNLGFLDIGGYLNDLLLDDDLGL